jgi:hypothetical protein
MNVLSIKKSNDKKDKRKNEERKERINLTRLERAVYFSVVRTLKIFLS